MTLTVSSIAALQLLGGSRGSQADAHGGIEEAAEMGVAFEDLAAIDADALEDAVAVEQTVVVDADLGVVLVEEFAVDPDLQGHVRT